jgi:hypothetical protein
MIGELGDDKREDLRRWFWRQGSSLRKRSKVFYLFYSLFGSATSRGVLNYMVFSLRSN